MPPGRPRNIVKDLKPDETRAKPSMAEVGRSVVSPFSLFNIEDVFDESRVTIDDLDRMIQTDGQAQSLYRLLTMPIRAGETRVTPTEGGVNEAAFIEAQLLNPPERGGMTTPWPAVLGAIAKYVLTGAEVLEKVYQNRNGHIILRKLAPRPRNSITIQMDNKGGFDGIKQALPEGEVRIPQKKC